MNEKSAIAVTPPGEAFASFEEKWLAAQPEQIAVAYFLAPDVRLRASAFGCLIHELEQAAFGVRETQIAAVKLAWWRQELAAAVNGAPRHPVSAVLFADPRSRAVDAHDWLTLADGAMAMLDERGVTSFEELITGFAPLYASVARAECDLFDGNPKQQDAVATLWTISHLLHALPATFASSVTVPLDLLARHNLTRTALANDESARQSVLRDYLKGLRQRYESAMSQAKGATLSRRVAARVDLERMSAALRARDPLAWLQEHPSPSRWRSLWIAWNQARLQQTMHDVNVDQS